MSFYMTHRLEEPVRCGCAADRHIIEMVLLYRSPTPVAKEEKDILLDHWVSLKQKQKISVGMETNRNKICFCCVSVYFVKPKTKKFGLFFVCFSV
jgi:hypothetical protein